ncbi:ATP-binding cassette sub- A member 1 [Gonapodya sp. JEL0774]|nr:ATP-binding cassette sub- A member 1 [Gonapodya sp. JEL0774]
MAMRKTKIFAGSSHPELASLIVDRLGVPLAPAFFKKFPNQEMTVEIGTSVRDEDVFIIQSGSASVNDNLMELLLMVNACKMASAGRITAVLPYFPYAKQSKKKKVRSAIAAKLVAQMIGVAGVDHVITMDLHGSQMQGFFSKPVDNLLAEPAIARHIMDRIPEYQNGVVVSKNVGGAKRVTSLADRLRMDFALVHRERLGAGLGIDEEDSKLTLVGDVSGRICFIVDDVMDDVHGVCEAAVHLVSCRATRVYVIGTHGILSDSALELIETCDAICEIIVTNTYPISEEKRKMTRKLRSIDISGVLAEAIRRTHNGESISYLFYTAHGRGACFSLEMADQSKEVDGEKLNQHQGNHVFGDDTTEYTRSELEKRGYLETLGRQFLIMMTRNYTLYVKRYYQSTIAQIVIAPIIFLLLLFILQKADTAQQLRSNYHPLSYPLNGIAQCQGATYRDPCINVMFSPPSDPVVLSIMSVFAQGQKSRTNLQWNIETPLTDVNKLPDRVWGLVPVPDADFIYAYSLANPNVTQYAIVWNNNFSVPSAPNYRYQIWFNYTTVGNGSDVFGMDVVSLTRQLDEAIISYANSPNVDANQIQRAIYDIKLKDWPYIPPSATSDSIVQSLGTVFFFCAAMVIFINILNTIVQEKELKLRHAMQMMGLKSAVYWISYFVTYALETAVASLVTCVFGLAFQFEAFKNANFGVLFFTFFLFGLAMNNMAFFITTLVRRSSVGVLIGIFLFIVGLLFESFVFSSGYLGYIWWENVSTISPTGWKGKAEVLVRGALGYANVIFGPQCFFGKMFLDITTLTTGKIDTLTSTYIQGPGFPWAQLYNPVPNNLLPVYGDYQPIVPAPVQSWHFLLIDIVFFGVLTWYFDQVIQDEFGVARVPWFLVTPSYWGFGKRSKGRDDDQWVPWLNSVKAAAAKAGLDKIDEEDDEDVAVERQKTLNTADKSSAVRIAHLRKVYYQSSWRKTKNDKVAVSNLNLTFEEGTLLALLGQNGAGKSTTINILSGMTPPTLGDALIYGFSVRDDQEAIRSIMGVCPQHDILFSDLTAEEHIALYGGLKGVSYSTMAKISEERLKAVRLWNVKDQRAGTYSGGMKRRLSMMISTIGDPKIIFMVRIANRFYVYGSSSMSKPRFSRKDEPTTGMDPVNRRHVWAFIERFKKGRVIVLTTHSMEEADVLGDRIGIMAHARIRALGSSLRLKSKFGAGYRISVVTDATTEVMSFAKLKFAEFIPESVLEDDSAGALIYQIPSVAMSKMPAFVKYLDSNPDGFVKAWGISQTTLEEVFLRLIREAEGRDLSPQESAELEQQLLADTEVATLRGADAHAPFTAVSALDWKSEWRWRFGKLRMFDTSYGIGNHNGVVWSVVQDERTEHAFSSGSDGAVKYWKLMPANDGGKDFGCVRTIFASEGIAKVDAPLVGESSTVAKMGDGALLCTWRGHLRVLDIEYGRFLATIPASTSPISAVLPLHAPHARLCATGDASRTVKLWDFRVPPTRHSHPTTEWKTDGTVLALAQAGNAVVAGGRFRSLMRFDVKAGKLEKAMFTGGYVHSLMTGSQTGLVIAGGGDRRGGTVDLWDVSVGHRIARHSPPRVPHGSFVSCIAGNGTGGTPATRVCTTSWDGVVALWDGSCSKVRRVVMDVKGGAASFTCASVGEKRLVVGHFGGVSSVEVEAGRFEGRGEARLVDGHGITDEFWESDEDSADAADEGENGVSKSDLWRVLSWDPTTLWR